MLLCVRVCVCCSACRLAEHLWMGHHLWLFGAIACGILGIAILIPGVYFVSVRHDDGVVENLGWALIAAASVLLSNTMLFSVLAIRARHSGSGLYSNLEVRQYWG